MIIEIKYWPIGEVTIAYRLHDSERFIFSRSIERIELLLNEELKVGNFNIVDRDEGVSSTNETTIWFIAKVFIDTKSLYICTAPPEWKFENAPFTILTKRGLDYTVESHKRFDVSGATVDRFTVRCEDNAPPF